VWNRLFVCQELIDVFAVGSKQIAAIPDSNHHGIEFIRIERKKKTNKADEVEQVLPKATRGGNR